MFILFKQQLLIRFVNICLYVEIYYFIQLLIVEIKHINIRMFICLYYLNNESY